MTDNRMPALAGRLGIGGNFPPPENLMDRGAPCMILQRANGDIEIKAPSYERLTAEIAKYPHTFGPLIEEDAARWCAKGKR